jgi:Stage II sporulation protein E (SpoIIE)
MAIMHVTDLIGALGIEQLTTADHVRDTPILIFGVFALCLSAAFLALWRAAPDYRVFLSMGLYFVVLSTQQFWRYFAGTDHDWVLGDLSNPFLVITDALALQVKNWRWTWLLWPVYLFNLIAGWTPSMDFSHEWSLFVAQIAIVIFIAQTVRKKDSRLQLIAAGFVLVVFVRCTVFDHFCAVTSIPHSILIRGWRWYLTTPIMVLMGIVTLVVYVGDLIQDRKDKERLAAELEAARAVQQVLIPDQTLEVPGFRVESAYKPAGEVGGDFFQIIPSQNGSTLVVLGDVSGKGLKAAMTVSLTVGMIRAFANVTARLPSC